MGWWSIGEDELSGDDPADITAEAFGRLAQRRVRARKPPLRYEDVVSLIAASLGRERYLLLRPSTKPVALRAVFDDAPEVRVAVVDTANVDPDELVAVGKWMKKVGQSHQMLASETGRRWPTARETLEAASFVLGPVPNDYLAADETRKLKNFVAEFSHASGQLAASDVVASLAAVFRRNERRLGLMVDGGASIAPVRVVATTASGQEVSVSCESASVPRDLVEEMAAQVEAVLRRHRRELPAARVKALSPQELEAYERRLAASELPSLAQLLDALRTTLSFAPERWEPLATLRLDTNERSPVGLPSRVRPAPTTDQRLHVQHATLGHGRVERTTDDGDRKYEVLFDSGKRLTLMARFLEVVAAPVET
jgi:hypothetical protein